MSLRAAVTKSLTDWLLLTVIGISLVGLALRIAPLSESLWLDELHTAWCAIGPLDEVAPRAALGNQSPLFYWLEWLLIGVLGESELTLRLPSLIAGSLLPLAVFLLARRWKADVAGVVAAALIAVDPWSIFYATEARPYATQQLLAVIHVALTAELVVKPMLTMRLSWVGVAALLFHWHYTAALFIVAEVLFLIAACIASRTEMAYRWPKLLGDLALLAVLCLPALFNVWHIYAHRENWAAFIEQNPLSDALAWTALPGWSWWLLIPVAVIGWTVSRRLQVTTISSRSLWLTGLWMSVPLILAWLATTTDVARLFFPRYVVAALPAAALFAGLCIQLIPWRWARLSLGLVTFGIAIWANDIAGQIRQDGRIATNRNEDWRGCIAWLNERIETDGLPVFVYSGYIEADELAQPHDELLDEYCLSPVNSLYLLDVAPSDMFPLPMHEPGRLPQPGEMLSVHRAGAWIIVRGKQNQGRNVADQICQTLQNSAANSQWKTDSMHSFGKVQAILIRATAK